MLKMTGTKKRQSLNKVSNFTNTNRLKKKRDEHELAYISLYFL